MITPAQEKRNTSSIGAWPDSLDRRQPKYCIVFPLLKKSLHPCFLRNMYRGDGRTKRKRVLLFQDMVTLISLEMFEVFLLHATTDRIKDLNRSHRSTVYLPHDSQHDQVDIELEQKCNGIDIFQRFKVSKEIHFSKA